MRPPSFPFKQRSETMQKRPTDQKRQQNCHSDTKTLPKEPRAKRPVVSDEEILREAEWMEEGFACYD